MKVKIIFLLLFTVGIAHSQSLKVKTKYLVSDCQGNNCIKMDSVKREIISKKGEKITVQQQFKISGVESTINKEIILDKDLIYEIDTVVRAKDWGNRPRKASVKFVDNKLYVNKYLVLKDGEDLSRSTTYYFELKNRERISLKHNGVYLSALTIPIKYRPTLRDKEGNRIEEEWSTGFNANIFISTTLSGHTNFTFLKNTENAINDHNFRLGGFLGVSTIKLNSSNTANAPDGLSLTDGEEITKGLLSSGLGFTYTYNKFGVGFFVGWDFALGKQAFIWDYDGAPWLGLSIGIDVLKIGSIGEN